MNINIKSRHKTNISFLQGLNFTPVYKNQNWFDFSCYTPCIIQFLIVRKESMLRFLSNLKPSFLVKSVLSSNAFTWCSWHIELLLFTDNSRWISENLIDKNQRHFTKDSLWTSTDFYSWKQLKIKCYLLKIANVHQLISTEDSKWNLAFYCRR